MVGEKLVVAGHSTVDAVKYLPCLYTAAEVLMFGTPAFILGIIVGFVLGYSLGI